MRISIIIRTYNEERYLGALLSRIHEQIAPGLEAEVVVVDSGSTDDTLRIANQHGARLVQIPRDQFSFGRSLNCGCAAARGDILVFVSGHCVPVNEHWLQRLVAPLINGTVALTYGRQVGGPETKFSETQLFAKFFPATSRIPQDGFFCNNANAAMLRSCWERHRFDETLTGLEDLAMGRELIRHSERLGYVAEAAVYHHHHESWKTVKRRYEREAIALQHIMPEIHITFVDFLRYFVSAVQLDLRMLICARPRARDIKEIALFRFMQFWGSYRGNHEHRQLSQKRKELYFYPKS